MFPPKIDDDLANKKLQTITFKKNKAGQSARLLSIPSLPFQIGY